MTNYLGLSKPITLAQDVFKSAHPDEDLGILIAEKLHEQCIEWLAAQEKATALYKLQKGSDPDAQGLDKSGDYSEPPSPIARPSDDAQSTDEEESFVRVSRSMQKKKLKQIALKLV